MPNWDVFFIIKTNSTGKSGVTWKIVVKHMAAEPLYLNIFVTDGTIKPGVRNSYEIVIKDRIVGLDQRLFIFILVLLPSEGFTEPHYGASFHTKQIYL